MGKRHLRIDKGHRADMHMTPRRARLFDERHESSIRHYVWGTVIVVMGLLTLRGSWFLLGG